VEKGQTDRKVERQIVKDRQREKLEGRYICRKTNGNKLRHTGRKVQKQKSKELKRQADRQKEEHK
jgi:hypothetical protein